MPNWPGDTAVFAVAEPFIKAREALSLTPYLDSAGVATIGWGTIQYPDGQQVAMDDSPITQDYAEQCLRFEMTQKCNKLQALLQRPILAHQAAAMLSLIYNIGIGGFSGSTVLRDFNQGNIQGSADAFLLWDKARVKGQLVAVQGLLNRRNLERTLFLTADAA